jgi:hypothetical protein
VRLLVSVKREGGGLLSNLFFACWRTGLSNLFGNIFKYFIDTLEAGDHPCLRQRRSNLETQLNVGTESTPS